MELSLYLQSPAENVLLKNLLEQVQKQKSISKKLQFEKRQLLNVAFFYHILEQHPNAGLKRYLGSNTSTHFHDSEVGLANVLHGLPLSKTQQDGVAVFIPK